MMYPLGWGLGEANTKKFFTKYPNIQCRFGEGYVMFGCTVLRNFPGDCGSLLMTGANYANAEILKAAVEYASTCGFDKIFATLVKKTVEENLQLFLDAGFKVLSRSPSNRNDYKTSIALFCHIENPINKGYYYD